MFTGRVPEKPQQAAHLVTVALNARVCPKASQEFQIYPYTETHQKHEQINAHNVHTL